MRLSKKRGAIPEPILEAMNEAIGSLKDKCGNYYFDDLCFQTSACTHIVEAALVYSENEVNYYQIVKHFHFELTSADEAFTACLRTMLPDYTDEQISALAARLKRQFQPKK